MNNQQITGPVELLKSAWSFCRPHWKKLVVIILIPHVGLYIASCLETIDNPASNVLGFLVFLVSIVFTVVGYVGLIDSIKKLDTDAATKISLREQFSVGFKLFWPAVLVVLLFYAASLGSMILLVVPGIIVGVYVHFASFALIVDGKKGLAAFTESFAIIKGRWWKVLWRFIFITIINYAAILIVIGFMFLVGYLFGYRTDSSTISLISHLLQIIVVVVFVPLSRTYTYKLYQSLKATRAPEVSTQGFKKWLVTFIVIAVLAIVGMPVVLVFLFGVKQQVIAAQLRAQIEASQATTTQK